MSGARDAILGRIRAALHPGGAGPSEGILSGGGGGEVLIPREYRRRGTRGAVELLDLLQDRLEDYRATVLRCQPAELPDLISRRLEARGAGRLVTPPGLPGDWLREAQGPGLEILRDLSPGILSNAQLDSAHAVLTGCALAMAETGTLVLDGGASQGRRALSLLPDYHLCVVFQHQVVEAVPEAVETLMGPVTETRSPLTLISGPSATSDIELIRVEGVHGPRTLDVILVEES